MIQIYLSKVHCHAETDEVGADEPYVIVTAVNLASSINVAGFPVPIPAFEVVKYGPFGDVDEGEKHYAPGTSQSFWGVSGGPTELDNPDQVIFVVALMENDDGDSEAMRGIVKGIVGGSVLGSLSLSRTDKIQALIRDIGSALGTPTGALNFDDKVGPPQELSFSREELALAKRGGLVSKTLFTRGDGGHYNMTFEAVNEYGLFGAIRDKWVETGRVQGPLSTPTSPELPTFDGVGRYRNFVGGIVSWHPELGAHAIWGSIGERWLQIGREQFGYPITDELPAADGRGRFNHLRTIQLEGKPEASIYWSPETGAHELFGAIRAKWCEMGFERSHLGYPVSPEHDHAGGRIQRFQGGSLFWTPQGGVVGQ